MAGRAISRAGKTLGGHASYAHMRRLRRRIIVSVAAVLAISVGAPVTYAVLSGSAEAIPGAAAVSAFVNELASRSPGARTQADLIKTKRRLTSEMLSSAVLPKDNPILAQAPAGLIDFVSPVAPITEDILPVLAGPLFASEAIPLIGSPPGGPGAIPPGGGGVVTPPGTDTPPGPPSVSPVPEPSTWATMLLGFLLVGWAIRRRPMRKELPAKLIGA